MASNANESYREYLERIALLLDPAAMRAHLGNRPSPIAALRALQASASRASRLIPKVMRNPHEVLTAKLQQYKQLLKEIESLRVVIPLLDEPDAPKESQAHES
jgi:hypothetical protein